MAVYSHILLAVDFTPVTDTVTRQAMELCQAFKARLSLVQVVEFTQMDLSNDLVLPQELEIDQELMKRSKQRLEDLAEKLSIDKSECFVSQGSTRRDHCGLSGLVNRMVAPTSLAAIHTVFNGHHQRVSLFYNISYRM